MQVVNLMIGKKTMIWCTNPFNKNKKGGGGREKPMKVSNFSFY